MSCDVEVVLFNDSQGSAGDRVMCSGGLDLGTEFPSFDSKLSSDAIDTHEGGQVFLGNDVSPPWYN